MILEIIDRNTSEVINQIYGDTEEECDEQAVDMDYDDSDLYQWVYNV